MSPRPFQRALFLVLVVSAFVAQPLVARASAGIRWSELQCCCPDPDQCKCHDHDDGDGDGPKGSELRKCGRDGELVAPVVLPALSLPAAAIVVVPPAPAPAPPAADAIVPEMPTFEPITPPF